MLGAFAPAGAGRMIAREHRAQHASRIPREGVLFREPPDEAGGPGFNAHRRIAQPQSLGSATTHSRMIGATWETPTLQADLPNMGHHHTKSWLSLVIKR